MSPTELRITLAVNEISLHADFGNVYTLRFVSYLGACYIRTTVTN